MRHPSSQPLGPAFTGLWAATGAANLADGMARFLLPVLAVAIGAPPSGVAAVTAAITVAWLVFGLHAGWVVDRADRRALLLGVNLARGALLAVLAGLYAVDGLTLPVILGVALLLGVAETLTDTALTSTVPVVVGPTDYGRANARIEATINVGNELMGPSVAGLLAALALEAPAATGAGLYAAAALVLLATPLRRAPAPGSPQPAASTDNTGGVLDGLTFLWRQPLLRALTLFTAAMNVVWAAALALLVVYAVRPGPLGLSTTAFGLLVSAMAAGGLLASLITEPLRGRIGDARLMFADCVGTVLLVLPVALALNAWVVAAGAVVAGAGSSVWRIINATIRLNLAPVSMLGRVYSASRVISWGVIPVAATTAGVAADAWGVRAVFGGATVLAVVVAIAFVPYAARAERAARAGQDGGSEPDPLPEVSRP